MDRRRTAKVIALDVIGETLGNDLAIHTAMDRPRPYNTTTSDKAVSTLVLVNAT